MKENFIVKIETIHVQDNGKTENVGYNIAWYLTHVQSDRRDLKKKRYFNFGKK